MAEASSSTLPSSSSSTLPSSSSLHEKALTHAVIKLDDTNFYSWKQLVEGVIRAHKLQKFIQDPLQIPEQFLTEEDRLTETVNSAYSEWEQQDSTLFTWLLSTLSASLLPTVVQCRHSWQIWEEIHTFFNAHSKAQSTQLRSELKTITKGTKTATEYLKRIKTIVNTLTSIGEPVLFRDHLEAIFDGLPDEYSALMTVIYSRDTFFTISEVEAMVIAHEARFERMKKKQHADSTASVFLTQVPSQIPAPVSQPPSVANPSPSSPWQPPSASQSAVQSDEHDRDNGGSINGNYGGSYGRGRGRGRGRNTLQCTFCHKFGHDVSSCWSKPATASNGSNGAIGQSNFGNSTTAPNLGFSGAQFGNLGFPNAQFGGFGPYTNLGFPGANLGFSGLNLGFSGGNLGFPNAQYGGFGPYTGLGAGMHNPFGPWCAPPTVHGTWGSQFSARPQQQAGAIPRGFTPPTAPPQAPPQAMLATVPSQGPSPTAAVAAIQWFPDSGATHHVTNNPAVFVDNSPVSSSEQIYMGNGQGLPIQSIGHL
ncbi:uncharacterized protein LOC130723231 [Lotus japonicus]|uniref:uncharacterized protein LOC130723231 n=1 Tax=Lotus japonicus TaxID=34305 RepID=UPI0025904117|nr:uncharacterized protein LOC130723231 [Lotus japonicus]